MSAAAFAVLLPLLAAIGLACFGSPLRGAHAGLAVTGIELALTILVFFCPGQGLLQADPLGMIFGALSAFVALTTALGNIDFVRGEPARMSQRRWRAYHAAFQVLLGATLLGLYADNTGLLWAAMTMAAIATAFGVSLPQSAATLAAAWKVLTLSAVGIALALFGTMLLYLAAQPALGPGLAGLSFSALTAHATELDGRLLSLAFLFLLFGYGTGAALVPLHGWLPDAYAQGPAPLTAGLGGLPLNLGLIAILRFRHLLQANAAAGGAMPPGPLLLILGLASLLLTAFSLWRRRDSRRFFGLSSIGHSGIAAFAFGIGGAAAIFAGLLHMLLHTLIKSALFQALTQGRPATGKTAAWLLAACVFALTGLPPSGFFTSEFLIVSQTIQRQPLLSLPLGLGLGMGAIALLRRVGPLLYGPPPGKAMAIDASAGLSAAWLHLLAVLVLAFAMPLPLVRMLSSIAEALQ